MKEAAAVKEQVSVQPSAGHLLQRKCACGQHTGGGACSECEHKNSQALQRTATHAVSDNIAPPIVHEVLNSSGRPLDGQTRSLMESRFSHDFSRVRVHTDARAADSARAVSAMAYTVGRDIVFAGGHYAPHTPQGKSLLAHELTHVAQNAAVTSNPSTPIRIGPTGDRFEAEADKHAGAVMASGASSQSAVAPHGETGRLSRATFDVGTTKVEVNYGNLTKTGVADYESAIETRFTSWTGSPATTIHASLTALSNIAKEWVLYALDLLVDNPVAGLNKTEAVRRVIAHAPSSSTRPTGNSSLDFAFEKEALTVSGWSEKALTSGLTTPKGKQLTDAQQLINPGSTTSTAGSSTCPRGATDPPLDAQRLETELPPKLEAYLKTVVVQKPSTASFTSLLPIADAVQAQARAYYAPYADNSRGRGNTLLQQWTYSGHLVSTQSPAGTPTKDKRLAYIDSRSKKVGGAPTGAPAPPTATTPAQPPSGPSLFEQVHFDPRCNADETALDALVTKMETQSNITGLVDPILKQQSYTEQHATPKRVVLNPDSDPSECVARWKTIRTMCHELMHVMAHDDFRAAENGRQILTEGFPEVLGHYLYEHITGKLSSDAKLQAQMEAGLTGTPCSTVPGSVIGYKPAGPNAETIRLSVGKERFRAAFFLGQLDMVGLQPKRMSGAVTGNPHETEAESAAQAVAESRPVKPAVHRAPSVLDASQMNAGAGHSLEPRVRRDMENNLGHDFSSVRVHADASAAHSASAIGAMAYTVGRDIVFGSGQYMPETLAGRKLIAHELTHVVQQRKGHDL